MIVFGVLEPDSFLTEQNFANLLNQGAAIMVLAMGLVFVLLLGEIDLSAGFTAGMGAAILGVTLTNKGWAWPLSVLAALATGVPIGFTIALLVARLGIPSFVVSLAYFLGLQGAMLLIIGEGGTIPIRNEQILAVMNKNMPVGAGLAARADRHRRVRGGDVLGDPDAPARPGCRRRRCRCGARRSARSRCVVVIAVYLLNQERQRPNAPIVIQGVPWVVPLVVALVVVLTFLLTRTGFGRHVYAVGGNAEAARRAGIGVANIKTVCFILVLDAGDRRGHPARVARQLRLADDGRRADAALRGRRGGDRRHVAVRRARPDLRRGDGRPGGGDHRQRPAARHAEVGRAVHHQRPRAAARGQRRRDLPPEGGRNRQMIRWGILSTARIAETHHRRCARSPRMPQIVAVGSRDLARARAFADEHGIEHAYGSYEELLASPEIDAVYIPLPNSMHVEWSDRARWRPASTCCARSRWRAIRRRSSAAFDAAERCGRVLMEAFMWRFHPQTEELVRLVRDGAIGELRVIRAAFGFNLPWHGERPLGPRARGRRADGRRLLLRERGCG